MGSWTGNKIVVEPLRKGAPMHVGSIDTSNVRFTGLMAGSGRDAARTRDVAVPIGKVVALEARSRPLKLDGEFAMATSDFEVFDKAFEIRRAAHDRGCETPSWAATDGATGLP